MSTGLPDGACAALALQDVATLHRVVRRAFQLSRDDTAYVVDTFPIVRKNDEKVRGEYRTKRVILEIKDEMADVARTGKPYQTRLDPPPADPRVGHPGGRKKPPGKKRSAS